MEKDMVAQDQKSRVKIKQFINKLLKVWYWFIISMILGVGLAWFVNHYQTPLYKLESIVMVDENKNTMTRVSFFKDIQPNNEPIVLINSNQSHIGKLKSYMINMKTLKNLGWDISWYQKGFLYNKDLYGEEPYKITILTGKSNLTGIPLTIKQISASDYRISVKGEARIRGISQKIEFDQKGRFGEPFLNNHFGFIVDHDNNRYNSKNGLFFVFNDLESLVLDYQNNLKVFNLVDQLDLLHLSLTGSNPQHEADYLNELSKTYINYGLEEKNRVAENTIKFIDNQLSIITDSLSISENKFTNFRTSNQVVDLAQQGDIVMQKQESLESERSILKMRVDYLHNLLNSTNNAQQLKQVVAPSVLGINDQNLNTLVLKLSDLYSKREALSFTIKDKAPQIQILDNEIKMTHNNIVENVTNLLSSAEVELSNLQKRQGSFSNQLSILPKTEQTLINLRRKFDLHNELYTFLLKMRAESAISYASNQPDIKVLDPARVETALMIRPMKMINYSIGFILGLIFPIFIVQLSEYLNDSLLKKEDVTKLTRVPILGSIVHYRDNEFLTLKDNPRSNLAESFRLLRTNLKFILPVDKKKVIAVQSTNPGEGKSFISSNLATILAMNNIKVLLIDLDMRLPSLHKKFNVDNNKGISSYLGNQNNFDEIIENTSIENLSFIPSGIIPPNPTELLDNENFSNLIIEAQKQFDYIIMDNPPLSIVADGIITGRHADINLFIVRFGYSKRGNLALINDLVSKNTLPKITMVLNDATKNNYESSYNDKNHAYYYSSKRDKLKNATI